MEKVAALLFLMGIAALTMGGQGVYTVATNWTPTEIDCGDYLRKRPRAKWLKLENCALDLENAYQSSTLGLYVTEVLIPVKPIGSDEKTIQVLLATDGEKLEQFLERIQELSDGSPSEFTLKDREASLMQQRTVEGLVRFGLEFDNDDEEKIARTVENLAEDFILIDEGKEPDRFQAFYAFSLGLVLLPVSWILMTRDPSPKRSPRRGPAS